MSAETRAPQTPYNVEERLQIIQENFGKMTYKEIAVKCQCSYQTLLNDIREWRKKGGFIEWLYQRFGETQKDIETLDPTTAYKAVVRLIEREMTQKVQIDATIDVGEKLHAILEESFGVKRPGPPS